MNKYEILNTLSKEIFEDNKAKGFWDEDRNVGELLMLMVSELGEAMEAHRKGKHANIPLYQAVDQTDRPSHNAFSFQSTIKDTFEDEITDALIRIFDAAGGLGIDLAFHVEEKLKYNKTRPQKHGKKY